MSNFAPGNGFMIDLRMDPASLETLHGFENYEAMLEPALLNAMNTGISMLQAFAADYMYSHFKNPTGPTEDDSWEVDVQGPYLAILGNTAPQAQRLEYGFSGMTDRARRYFEEWPTGRYAGGYHWAEQTVILEQYKIEDVFQAAIDYANLQLGRTAP